ncbi:MAG: glycosyltransferase family 4 protein [Anaerolineae bacterium]|nr:glycosyltransferase family 4 protein [Anaerolineae bacterium]
MAKQELRDRNLCERSAKQRNRTSKAVLMMSTLPIRPIGPEYSTPVLGYTLDKFLKSGWSVYFLAGFEPVFDEVLEQQIHITWFGGSLIRRLRVIGDTVRKVGFFARLIWWIVAQFQFLTKGLRIIKMYNIDLIYTWDVISVPAAWFLSKLFGIPWVARYLGTWVPLPGKAKCFWKFRFWQEILAYSLPADLLIMTNDGTRGDHILRALGIDMNKVRFWKNGLDWCQFSKLPSPQEARMALGLNHKYILLSISRLVGWKRVDRIIRGIKGVVGEFPDVLLVIVGDGPDRRRLECLVSEIGVEEHVRFEGAIPRTEIPKYLAAADIFVILYDWSNVGNTLLEAMMAGKCIVTLNSGDTGYLIKNGENGILLEYEDLPRLPEIIKMLLTNDALRNRLGYNARKSVGEHFWSWEERLDAEIKEIERLVKEKQRWRGE